MLAKCSKLLGNVLKIGKQFYIWNLNIHGNTIILYYFLDNTCQDFHHRLRKSSQQTNQNLQTSRGLYLRSNKSVLIKLRRLLHIGKVVVIADSFFQTWKKYIYQNIRFYYLTSWRNINFELRFTIQWNLSN